MFIFLQRKINILQNCNVNSILNETTKNDMNWSYKERKENKSRINFVIVFLSFFFFCKVFSLNNCEIYFVFGRTDRKFRLEFAFLMKKLRLHQQAFLNLSRLPNSKKEERMCVLFVLVMLIKKAVSFFFFFVFVRIFFSFCLCFFFFFLLFHFLN
jgi:hypothetical protein